MHIVTGAGPVGWTIAEQLANAGNKVRVLTRSGSGPDHPNVEKLGVDVSDPTLLADAFDGAEAVYHCVHGSKYTVSAWRAELPRMEQAVLAAAGRTVVVFPESLYAYGPVDGPITEDLPRTATQGKLGVRTDLLRARAAADTPTVSVAAADFFGPRVRTAHAGERMVPTILAGKKMQVIGSLDQPHSFTYVPDLAAAMITAAAKPDLWNTFLHAPTAAAVTQRELITAFATAAGVPTPKMSAVPGWLLRILGVGMGELRELTETSYQLSKPFVLDSARSEAQLGLAPTPLAAAVAETVRWWRAQG